MNTEKTASLYLLTRFNIVRQRLADWAMRDNHVRVQTEEWLQKRFSLFEDYCLPSVCQQTETDFRWLVLFDRRSTAPHLDRIRHYQTLCPQLQPLFLEEEQDEIDYVREYIKHDTTATHIITTRLDNDDMIHRDYLALVRKAFRTEQTNTFLYYRYGYQYDTQRRVLVRFGDDYNHFTSRVELRESLNTVWLAADDHHLIDHYGDVLPLATRQNRENEYKGMWIEVAHGMNVTNSSGYSKPELPTLADFSPHLSISPLSYVLYAIRNSATQRIRRHCKRLSPWNQPSA